MLNRRKVLERLTGFALGGLVGFESSFIEAKAAEMANDQTKSIPLRLTLTHTNESYDLQLFVGSAWNANALIVCDYLMRDWRENLLVNCDRKLYATLYVIQRTFANDQRIVIHSGFRTKKTNDYLRETGHNAAVNSQHLHAKAVDFSIPGIDVDNMGRFAQSLKLGGVGFYDTFVHVDTRGEIATWSG